MALFSAAPKELLSKRLRAFIEFAYVSGFNFAWTISETNRRKPPARLQYRRWVERLLTDEDRKDLAKELKVEIDANPIQKDKAVEEKHEDTTKEE